MTETYHERLSGQDLSFLAMEDGRAHMHVGVVSLFDAGPLRSANGGIDFERIEEFVDAQLHLVPRLRQKLAWVKGFGQPVWVDDASFNLHYHLRHTALPPPGDLRQLKRLAGRIMSQELDRGKPLWEHWFVDGVEGGRFALISKVHHCVADGIGGLAIIGTLAGPDPDYRPDPPPDWVHARSRATRRSRRRRGQASINRTGRVPGLAAPSFQDRSGGSAPAGEHASRARRDDRRRYHDAAEFTDRAASSLRLDSAPVRRGA